MVGKPNQVVRPVPLCPIPVMGEPFERLILDCVGPVTQMTGGASINDNLNVRSDAFSRGCTVVKSNAKNSLKGANKILFSVWIATCKKKIMELILCRKCSNRCCGCACHFEHSSSSVAGSVRTLPSNA